MLFVISLVLPTQTCHWLCTASPSSAGCAPTGTRDPILSLMPPHAKTTSLFFQFKLPTLSRVDQILCQQIPAGHVPAQNPWGRG